MSSERFFHNRRSASRAKARVYKARIPKAAILLLVSVTIVFCIYQFRVLPIISTIALSNAETALQSTVAGEISSYLAQSTDDYSDLIEYRYDSNGDLLSYSVNQRRANLLINNVTKVISTSASVNEMSVSIPLGSIFNDTFFNSVGPTLKFKMIMTTSSFINLRSEFESQGINQTRHKILMEVTMPVELLIPGKRLESNIDTMYIVSDTVIIGKVPDICLQPVDLIV